MAISLNVLRMLISFAVGLAAGFYETVYDGLAIVLNGPEHASDILRWRKDELVGLSHEKIIAKLGRGATIYIVPDFGPIPDSTYDLVYEHKDGRLIVAMKQHSKEHYHVKGECFPYAYCIGVVREPLSQRYRIPAK